MNFSTKIDYILERKKKEDPGEQWRHGAVKKVMDKIYAGGSALKGPLQAGIITIRDVVHAIKHNRCLGTPDRDFGTTYLEQIIGGAIRDVIPIDAIPDTRRIFGLDKLSPSELAKHVEKAQQQRNPQTRKARS